MIQAPLLMTELVKVPTLLMKLTVPALVNTASTIKRPLLAPNTPLVWLNTVLPVKCSGAESAVANPVPELMMLEVMVPKPRTLATRVLSNGPWRRMPPSMGIVPRLNRGRWCHYQISSDYYLQPPV